MKKTKVYYIPADKNIENPAEAMRHVLEHRAFRLFRSFWKKQLVGLHCSGPELEKGRRHLVKFLKSAAESLRESEVCAFVCATSNRHRKISSNALEQIEEAYCGGFDGLRGLLPFFMLDGINGQYEYVPKTAARQAEVYLGGEIPNLDGLVMFSIPYRHHLGGLAGAIYGTGVCLASKRGKIKQHTQSKPQVNVEKCYACRRCLRECPVKAISVRNKHVAIDEKKCVDCGKCVEIAKHCGISYQWDATPEHFQQRMFEHAATAGEILKTKIIHINILPDPRKDEGAEVLISRDPVALDAATIALAGKNGYFTKEESEPMSAQIEAAVAAGLGRQEYELVGIAY